MRILPILFNTDMVRAILDGRKTVTRRTVKSNQYMGLGEKEPLECLENVVHRYANMSDADVISMNYKQPYQPGDYIYVRETWQYAYELDGNYNIIEGTSRYLYAADDPYPFNDWLMEDGTHRDYMPWKPSIHMPKEAARIWLKVTDVRVERLQDMETVDDRNYMAEGAKEKNDFICIWNSTIKKSDLDRYSWGANPWVWVIEFERCEKPESEG